MAEAKPRKQKRRQLRVVFDTNALYTDSESYLVRLEVANLIKKSVYADLEIQWYLPEVVRHERQYQMQKKALELLPAVEKLDKLLGRGLAIDRETLVDGVEKIVSQRFVDLGLQGISLNYSQVNWHELFLDSVYRRAPFKEGEAEKGFRDRLVVECFLQLVAESPKTPAVCRVVLVSGDGLVARSVANRTADLKNVEVFKSLEALKELINTLVSQVDEGFLAILKPKANKLFWVMNDQSTLLYKYDVRGRLEEKFAKEMTATPPGATNRTNGTWGIYAPNFVSKSGHRVQWATRICIETEASKTVSQPSFIYNDLAPTKLSGMGRINVNDPQISNILSTYYSSPASPASGLKDVGSAGLLSNLGIAGWEPAMNFTPMIQEITTHKGRDIYEVSWSADLTTKQELRRASVDDIRHAETTWEPVS